jgi:hypothetical protein
MVESKTSMKEFLMAILEDNSAGQRNRGLQDNDMIELYE